MREHATGCRTAGSGQTMALVFVQKVTTKCEFYNLRPIVLGVKLWRFNHLYDWFANDFGVTLPLVL